MRCCPYWRLVPLNFWFRRAAPPIVLCRLAPRRDRGPASASPAYRQIAQILDPEPLALNTRPLIPLHKGHVGLLSTAGLLNGSFGSGDRLHVAAWKTKKRVIKTEDTEDEKIIIREREQFVHELAVAFANGETALIE